MFYPITALVFSFAIFVGTAGCVTSEKKPPTQEERMQMMFEIGNAALKEGDPIGALEQFFKIEQEKPNWAELRLAMALAYYAKNDFTQALHEARKSVSIKPNYSEANNTLGKFLLDAGKYQEASQYLRKALEDPLYRETYKTNTNMGILHYRLGEIAKAQNYFDKATATNPLNSCIAYYYKGHILLKKNNFSEAIRNYQKATDKFCTQFMEGHLALGIAYERSGQYHMARKKFLEIKDRFPNSKFADEAINRLAYLP